MIYFIRMPDGPILIGRSEDVPARLRQLRTSFRQALSILATVEGEDEALQEIHLKFVHLRFGRTEQFRAAPELLGFVDELSSSGRSVPTVPRPSIYRNIQMRTTAAYGDWLNEAARIEGTSLSRFLERAAADRARAIGFDEPPPDRLP